jgi:hypothetical protein
LEFDWPAWHGARNEGGVQRDVVRAIVAAAAGSRRVDYVNLGVPQPSARSRRSRAETPWRWERDGEQDDGGQLDVHPAEHIEHPS